MTHNYKHGIDAADFECKCIVHKIFALIALTTVLQVQSVIVLIVLRPTV